MVYTCIYSELSCIYIVDFGLARRIIDDAGLHKEQRSSSEFRGTSLYASVHSHEEKDLSRR